MGKREMLEARIDAALAELAKLDSIPAEPGREISIVWFEKRFDASGRFGSKAYTYAAIRVGDGKWYTTGPRSPKGYAWEELWSWIQADEKNPPEVWAVTELEQVG